MGANFSRYFVESPGNTIFSANYNGEFDNILDNFTPDGMDDASATVAAMQTTVDPGEVGTESLPTSLAGELYRIRHILAEISGKTDWYETPATSIEALAAAETGNSVAFEFEGAPGGASSAEDVLAKVINNGAIINAASLDTADTVAADFGSTNVKFGNFSHSGGSGNVLAAKLEGLNPLRGSLSAHFRNLSPGDYIAFNPVLGIEIYLDGSGFLNTRVTERGAATDSTKTTSSTTGSTVRSADTDFQSIIARWRLNDENGASTDLLDQFIDNVNEGTGLSSTDIDISQETDGGVWFFNCKLNEPSWDHYYAANGTMAAHSSAWTKTGTFTETVSNGVNTYSITAQSGNLYYTKNSPTIDLNAFTVQTKVRVVNNKRSDITEDMFYLDVGDASRNESVRIHFADDVVSIIEDVDTTPLHIADIYLNTKQWHLYRLTLDNGTAKFYIDHVLVYEWTLNAGDSSLAADRIRIGGSTGSAHTAEVKFEHVAYVNSVEAPVSGNASGEMDSIAITDTVLGSSTRASLQTSRATDVLKVKNTNTALYMPPIILTNRDTNPTTTSTVHVQISDYVFYVAGDGVSEWNFDSNMSVKNNTASTEVELAFDINSDLLGGSGISQTGAQGGASLQVNASINSTARFPAAFKRTIVLPPGLHTVKPVFKVTGGQAEIDNVTSSVYRSVLRRKL